jgi:hypothetical protein
MKEKTYGRNKRSYGVSVCQDGCIEVRVYHDNQQVRQVLRRFTSNPAGLLSRSWKGDRAAVYMGDVIEDFRQYFHDGHVRIVLPDEHGTSSGVTAPYKGTTPDRLAQGNATGSDQERLKTLEEGPLYAFRDWPNEEVRGIEAAVYTIWDGTDFMYVGISKKNLFGRLRSHSRGVRGGDQFNIYVCDWLVLPRLGREQIDQVCSRQLSLDDLTREYVQSRFGYRFVAVEDEPAARELEARIKTGALSAGKPFLNPG